MNYAFVLVSSFTLGSWTFADSGGVLTGTEGILGLDGGAVLGVVSVGVCGVDDDPNGFIDEAIFLNRFNTTRNGINIPFTI